MLEGALVRSDNQLLGLASVYSRRPTMDAPWVTSPPRLFSRDQQSLLFTEAEEIHVTRAPSEQVSIDLFPFYRVVRKGLKWECQ